jgi:hypothetical protein
VRLLEVRAEGVLDVLGVVDEVQDDEVGLGLAVGGAVEAGEGAPGSCPSTPDRTDRLATRRNCRQR